MHSKCIFARSIQGSLELGKPQRIITCQHPFINTSTGIRPILIVYVMSVKSLCRKSCTPLAFLTLWKPYIYWRHLKDWKQWSICAGIPAFGKSTCVPQRPRCVMVQDDVSPGQLEKFSLFRPLDQCFPILFQHYTFWMSSLSDQSFSGVGVSTNWADELIQLCLIR